MTTGGRLSVVDDPTPLNGPQVSVGARAGWVLRMARTGSGEGSVPRLEDMAEAVGSNATRLHRLEIGTVRDGALVDGYERVLGLPRGSLSAAIDVLCRTFPEVAPADRSRRPAADVSTASRLTERLLSGPADGGTWLAWSRVLAVPGAVGLPESIALELLDRLVGELNRSTGTAYPTRYEALSLMRSGPYGHLVLEVARQRVDDPHVQVLNDLVSAVSEFTTPSAITWAIGLLADDRDHVATAGTLALENMAATGRQSDFWPRVAEDVIAGFNDSEPGSTRWDRLSHLIRLAPATALAASATRPAHRLAPLAAVRDWSRSRLNDHWSDCEQRARAVTTELGEPDQPLLARLLFDLAVSPHETRAVTSYLLLSALPWVAAPVDEHLAEIAQVHQDQVVRDRTTRRLGGARHGTLPAASRSWAEGSGDRLQAGLLLHGCAGVPVGAGALDRALDHGGDVGRAALFAAGMADPGTVAALAAAPGRSAEVRGGATWWAREGGRVHDGATQD